MTTDHKRALWTIGIGAIIVILLLLRHASNSVYNSTQQIVDNPVPPEFQDGPTVAGASYDFGPINLGSIHLDAPAISGGGCDCGCSVPNVYANQYQTAANSYTSNLVALQNQIEGAYRASIPPYVSQYLDDAQASAQFNNSTNIFNSLSGSFA